MPADLDFLTVKREVMASGRPSDGEDLRGMQADFDVWLHDSDRLNLVEVRTTDDPACLLSAICLNAPGAGADEVEYELVRIWTERLCYQYRESHRTTTSSEAVELDAVTQLAPAGLWVTGRVTVRLLRSRRGATQPSRAGAPQPADIAGGPSGTSSTVSRPADPVLLPAGG
ncbi:MAG: hypothetical protein ACRDYU_01425 [Actinomycetes bacterium]